MRRLLLLLWIFLPGLTGEAATFSRDIAPLLQAKCISCHNAEKAKGGFRVHNFAALAKAGKSKERPIVAGQPEESELFKRLTTTDEDDRMPQKDEPLSSEQIELFRAWISAGAQLDQGQPESELSGILPVAPYPAPPEKYRRPLPIIALAFTPNGKELAVSGYHEITFWSVTGELNRRLTHFPQRTRSLAFDSRGQYLAAAGGSPGRSGELLIYDLASRRVETNLLHTGDEMLAVAFSPDGRLLACAGTDNAIHLFDWENRRPLQTIQQHADWVGAITFNTNGTQIASASRDRTARIYDTANGNLITTYTGQNAPLSVIAFLSSGLLVSGGREHTLHLWEPKDGKKKGEIAGLNGDCYALTAAENSLFITGADGEIRQYSAPDRKLIRTLGSRGEAIYSLAYDTHTKTLAGGSYAGQIQLWNVETGALDRAFVAAPGWTAHQ